MDNWEKMEIIQDELTLLEFEVADNPRMTPDVVTQRLRQLADWIEAGMPEPEDGEGN